MAIAFEGWTYGRESELRGVALALLASIALHAVLLVALQQLHDAVKRNAVQPVPLVARLAPLRAAATHQPGVEKAPQPLIAPAQHTTGRETRTPSAARRPVPAAAAVPAAIPAQSTALQGATPVAEAARSGEPSAPSPSPAAPIAPSAAPASSSPASLAKVDPQFAPLVPSDTAEPVSLNQYRLTIISAAKRYKRYPRMAIDNNWEGRAVIRMMIGANGLIASIGVKSSAGHDILDREAIEMIKKAKPLAPIPAVLRGKDFAVEIPVEFSLKEEG